MGSCQCFTSQHASVRRRAKLHRGESRQEFRQLTNPKIGRFELQNPPAMTTSLEATVLIARSRQELIP